MRFHFTLVTSTTAVSGDQLSLFNIELLRLVYHPFMMAVLAQGFALVLLLQRRLAERYDIGHKLHQRALQG